MKLFPQKKKINIGNSVLEYIVSGTKSPTIVLINGSGVPIEDWHRILPALETMGSVFAYNRPGIGESSKPREAQTCDVMIQALRALLLQSGLVPPYVLVGHSLGGLIANLFARIYPAEVSGVVLVEAPAPEVFAVIAAHKNILAIWDRFVQRVFDALSKKDELGEFETAQLSHSIELIRQAPAFPDIPLVVVTGSKLSSWAAWLTPKSALAEFSGLQRQLAQLSPRGKQVIATNSKHFPHLTEPSVVVQAISDVIAMGHG